MSLGLLVSMGLGISGCALFETEEPWGYDLGHEMMSPYCPGRTLATCPSPQAAELVQWIVMQEAGGATRDEVIEMLIARFGEDILGAPPAEGATLWAYILPVSGFVIGGGLAFFVLRRMVRGAPEPTPAVQNEKLGDDSGNESNAGRDAAGTVVEIDSGAGTSQGSSDAANEVGEKAADDELARIVDEELAKRA